VKLTVSNKNGSSSVTRAIVLGTPATPPTSADFTWTPSRPKPGEEVTFTGSTTGGDPATRWEWNFGGGATAQGQTVKHTFIGDGAFKVQLIAGNSGGNAGLVEKTVDVKSTLTYLLPVVTHAEGSHGSAWRTDLHVYQPEFDNALPVEVELTFKGLTKNLFLDGSTKIYEDLLGEITSLDDAGPVFVHSPVQLDMWTRTYNISASGVGTFGQLIPAVLLDDEGAGTVVGNRTWNLGGVRYSDRFRTNLGFVNPTATTANLKVTIYEDGFEEGSFSVSINPYALDQKALQIWHPALERGDGALGLRIESLNDVPVISYASVIDNLSNDPFYIGAVSDSVLASSSNRVLLVPGVGHIGRWRSDLSVFNSDTQGVELKIEFFDESGEILGQADGVKLAGKASLAIEDVVQSEIIGVDESSLGMLRVTTSKENERFPFVFVRTYSDQTAAGTFGQGIPAFAKDSPNVRPGKPGFVPGVRSDPSYYTNLGLVSTSDETTEVVVQLLHPNTGDLLTQRSYVLEPDQSKIIPRVISDYLASEASSGTLKIIVQSGGPVWAYGSVVDKLTNDPEYVPAVPTR
jgi:PKD repeat protein